MHSLVFLFGHLFVISVITVGGGAQALLYDLTVNQTHWLSGMDFASGLALTYTTPGPNILILPVFIGYRVGGLVGVLVGLIGIFLSPMILAGLVTGYVEHLFENPLVRKIEAGARSAIVGLLVLTMWKIFAQVQNPMHYGWIAVLAFFLCLKKVNPIFILACGAVIGLVLGKLF